MKLKKFCTSLKYLAFPSIAESISKYWKYVSESVIIIKIGTLFSSISFSEIMYYDGIAKVTSQITNYRL